MKSGEITGTQPSGLGNKDIWCGRFVRFDSKRADASGALPEYRYVIDNAEKFFYELPSTAQYTCGTATIGSNHPMPNVYEPPITIAKGGLSACITRVQDFGVAIGTTAVSDQAPLTIPPDTDTTEERTGSGTAPTVGNAYGVWYDIAANNILCKNELKCATSSTNANTGTWTASYNVDVTPDVSNLKKLL